MSRMMQTIQEDIEAIVPYSMHVSSRYLELTKKKLELTRLPRENATLSQEQQWALGTPKSVLEPLLDHWLESYDWRAEEDIFNSTLPQFRTLIPLPPCNNGEEKNSIRVHFVHKRSADVNAIPLLYCHSWPGSFIEVQRIINELVNPKREGELSFHVVCPSIPGFGFSDASEDPDFGVHGVAEVFTGLMRRLGYERWVVCGSGWGFDVARALAMKEPKMCLAVHTCNPTFAAPTVRQRPLLWMKWQLARLTKAKYPALSFGYLPSELKAPVGHDHPIITGQPIGPTMHQLFSQRPQTLAFSLCDSPIGLLAVLLDLVATQSPTLSLHGRPRSPFLDPEELETIQHGSTSDAKRAGGPLWGQTDILNWTMMMWLPGAEAGLRWLRRAQIETSAASWSSYCTVPLGISSFRTHAISTPLMWGSASWLVTWVGRHNDVSEIPAWEAPTQSVKDIRECFTLLLEGRLKPESPDVIV